MKDLIIKSFYEDIIPNASERGIIEIDGNTYNMHFNTIIGERRYEKSDNVPCLIIKDIEKFNDALCNYVEKEFDLLKNPIYDEALEIACGGKEYNLIKYILMLTLINAREEDFKNPVEYLKLRTDFIERNELNDKYGEYTKIAEIDGKEIEIKSRFQLPSLETPYVFCPRIKSYDNSSETIYNLPEISYGISNDEVYIYSIQGKKKRNEDKKTNRFLYKINKDIKDSDEYYNYKKLDNAGYMTYYPENITDVTHSSVLSLTLFLSIIKKEGFEKITAVDFLPLRYLSKSESLKSRVNLLKLLYTPDDLRRKHVEQEYIQDMNQNNITNKFIRTFNRVNHQLNNMNIIAYPNEIDNSMHIKLNDNKLDSDNILNIVYNMVLNQEKRK